MIVESNLAHLQTYSLHLLILLLLIFLPLVILLGPLLSHSTLVLSSSMRFVNDEIHISGNEVQLWMCFSCISCDVVVIVRGTVLLLSK
jgi:hypothetical protein